MGAQPSSYLPLAPLDFDWETQENIKSHNTCLNYTASYTTTLVVSDHVMDGWTSYLDSAATDRYAHIGRFQLKTQES